MFPQIILLDNFNGCNLRCSICDHKNMKRPVKRMDINLYCKLIEEIAQESPGIRVWEIFFGDPFLCGDMASRIKMAKDAGLRDVVLNTNGFAMKEKKAAAYIEAGLDWIYVGVDAATEETYDKIRVGSDFKRVVENVLSWRRLKNNIFVQFVECDINRHEVEAFTKFWNDNGVRVKVRPMVSWIGLVETGITPPKKTERCYWFKNSFNVLNNGDVALCACDMHGRFIQGEVRTKTIKEVWMRYQQEEPPVCETCGDWAAASAKYIIPEERCTT